MLSLSPSYARRLALVVACVVALCGLSLPRAAAQTTSGTLVGTVYKPTGEPLAGAKVTATNELNGNSRSTVTGADGSYRIPFMPPGRYTMEADFGGRIERRQVQLAQSPQLVHWASAKLAQK